MKKINFLFSKISDKLNNNIHISNELLKQTIFDHKLILQKSSKIYNITSQVRSIYLHRDNLFVTKSLGISSDFIWIIRYINDIPSYKSLVETKFLYIPDTKLIDNIIDKCKILESYMNI